MFEALKKKVGLTASESAQSGQSDENVEALNRVVAQLRLDLDRAKDDRQRARRIYDEGTDDGTVLRLALDKYKAVEAELAIAIEREQRWQARSKLPALHQQLEALRPLIHQRDEHAERAQAALDTFRAELLAIDRLTAQLHRLTRDPAAGGVEAVGTPFHPLHSASRLRKPLRAAVAGTSYAAVVRRHAGLHSPAPELFRFDAVEKGVSRGMLRNLEHQIEQIEDALQHKMEVS